VGEQTRHPVEVTVRPCCPKGYEMAACLAILRRSSICRCKGSITTRTAAQAAGGTVPHNSLGIGIFADVAEILRNRRPRTSRLAGRIAKPDNGVGRGPHTRWR